LTFNENNIEKAVAMLERERELAANATDEKDDQSGGSAIRASTEKALELSDDEEEKDEVFKSLRSLRRTVSRDTFHRLATSDFSFLVAVSSFDTFVRSSRSFS